MAHVVCLLTVELDRKRATFRWSDGTGEFEDYSLQGQVFDDFQEVAEEAREALSNLVKDYLQNPDNVPQASYELAQIGHELYKQLFDPGAGQAAVAAEVREWLESLRHSHVVDSLEIVVETPWSMPWNVVYDRDPQEKGFLTDGENEQHWKPFWGIRYNLTCGRKVTPLRRMPFLMAPDILLVVDPTIRAGLPPKQQRRFAEFVQLHQFQVVTNKDELAEAIKKERPELIYWLSHATPEALVLNDEEVTPRQLRKMFRNDDEAYELGGLGFLNACRTAESSKRGSFFGALHAVGFSGMIGTEHETLNTFASELGLDFLQSFVVDGKPVGPTMRELRSRVPLGLLYGTYCPPDIRIKQRLPGGSTTGSGSVSVKFVPPDSEPAEALGAVATVQQPPPLPNQPYRNLAYYGYEHRALFAGRDDDIVRFATLLDDTSCRILVLHGESGVGKSSFLRAGVIPFLEDECPGYRFLRARNDDLETEEESVLFIRATNDPFGQLGRALSNYFGRPFSYPTPTGGQVEVDLPETFRRLSGVSPEPEKIQAALQNDPSLLGRLMAAIGRRLPHSAVLVIDQCEELFTLSQSADDNDRRKLAFAMLRRAVATSGNFKIILSLRTEYYGRLIDRLRHGMQETDRIREYLLTDFDHDALVEAIKLPTTCEKLRYSREVPADKYQFDFAKGVAEKIASDAIGYTTHRRDSVLPLVQVICSQLYERVRSRKDEWITDEDWKSLGGIEGGMSKHVDGLLDRLLQHHSSDKKDLQFLFTKLFNTQADGSLTTALLPEDDVARFWRGRMPFAELLDGAGKSRLLRVNTLRIGDQRERRYVSLGHDALAKLAAKWKQDLDRRAQVLKMGAWCAGIVGVALLIAVLAVQKQRSTARALTAEQQASENLRKAMGAADRWLIDVSADLQYYPGLQPRREQLLEQAETAYREFTGNTSEDKNMADGLDSLESARAGIRLADVLNLSGKRLEEAEQQYNSALAEFQRRSTGNSNAASNELSYELANCHIGLGMVVDDGKDAVDHFQKALTLLEQLLQRPHAKDNPVYRKAKARCSLGYARRLQKDEPDKAEQHYKTAKTLLDKLAAEDANNFEYNGLRTTVLLELGELLKAQAADDGQRFKDVRKVFGEVVRLCDELLATQPHRLDLLQYRAGSRLNVAEAQRELDRQEDSIASYELVLRDYAELERKLYAGFPHNTDLLMQKQEARLELARLKGEFGKTLAENAKFAEAAQCFASQVGLYDMHLRVRPNDKDYLITRDQALMNQAVELTNHGESLLALGQPREAVKALQLSDRGFNDLLRSQQLDDKIQRELAKLSFNFARALAELGEPSAQQHFTNAIEQFTTLEQFDEPQDRVARANCRSQLARLLYKLGQVEDAKQKLEIAVSDFEAAIRRNPDDWESVDEMADCVTFRGDLFWLTGDRTAATGFYAQAKQLRDKLTADPMHRYKQARLLALCPAPDIRDRDQAAQLAEQLTAEAPKNADFWNLRGVVSYKAEDWVSALQMFEQAAQLREMEDCADGFYLAMTYVRLGYTNQARAAYERAARTLESTRPGNIERLVLRAEAEQLLAP